MSDPYKEAIRRVLKASKEPLETKEVQARTNESGAWEITRSKLLHRLNDLRGEGEIRGKSVGPGKGVWIWWSEEREDDQ